MHIRILALLLCGLAQLGLLIYIPATAAETSMLPAEQPFIDLVVVIKSERVMYLYADNLMIKSFPISLGKQPLGRKRQSGDQRTPEGAYVLDWRNPNSLYHLSIHISYPNTRDRAWAAAHHVDAGNNRSGERRGG